MQTRKEEEETLTEAKWREQDKRSEGKAEQRTFSLRQKYVEKNG